MLQFQMGRVQYNHRFGTNWKGPTHTIQFGLDNLSGLNTSLPAMSFTLPSTVSLKNRIPNDKLVQLRSDSLSNQLVAFTVEDEGGMGEQGLFFIGFSEEMGLIFQERNLPLIWA